MRIRSAVTVFLVAGASVIAVCLLLWGNALSSASELGADQAPEKTTPAIGSVPDSIPVSFITESSPDRCSFATSGSGASPQPVDREATSARIVSFLDDDMRAPLLDQIL